eukprot:420574_1
MGAQQSIEPIFTSKSVTNALRMYIRNDAMIHNISLPPELVDLCSQMIGFILYSDIMMFHERLQLFEYLQNNNKLKIEYQISAIQLLYCNKMENSKANYYYRYGEPQFDTMAFTQVIEAKRNLIYVIKTEYNHVLCIFTPDAPQLTQPHIRSDVFIYLLRSQFGLRCQCPRQITHKRAIMEYDSVSCSRNGNELCGGTQLKSSRHFYRFKILHIEIHQIKSSCPQGTETPG